MSREYYNYPDSNVLLRSRALLLRTVTLWYIGIMFFGILVLVGARGQLDRELNSRLEAMGFDFQYWTYVEV